MNTAFSELAAELDKESAEWLQAENPAIFDALEVAVIRGESAEDIRAHVLRHVGMHRAAFATRCEQAARYLWAQKAK